MLAVSAMVCAGPDPLPPAACPHAPENLLTGRALPAPGRPAVPGYSMTMRSSRKGTGLAGDAAVASVRGCQPAAWSGVAGRPAMAGLEHALD
ncbi:hypothetical protein LHGZ1_3200 [Laribacter hongkongensis]|uniref:Uncharacterized protein n=1 Tax=Laribacter hongkongensis TaxID=168471 RepID=A0A248LNI1_9NEIS|nr:hypothetical protein LHGZ1_3200 [Laribacter hongkongensis]